MRAFVEKNAWVNYAEVALQKQMIFRPDVRGKATQFELLADRVDYLEAYGASVNAAIGADDGQD